MAAPRTLARTFAALVAAASLATFAACGDDGGSGGDEGAAPVTTGSGIEGTGTADTLASGEDPSGSDIGDDDSTTGEDDSTESTGPPGIDIQSEECQQLLGGGSLLDALFGGGEGEGGTDFAAFADAFDALASRVPDDVADDVVVIADAYRQFAEVAEQSGLEASDPNVLADPGFQAALAAFSTPEFADASANVASYAEEVCGTG